MKQEYVVYVLMAYPKERLGAFRPEAAHSTLDEAVAFLLKHTLDDLMPRIIETEELDDETYRRFHNE